MQVLTEKDLERELSSIFIISVLVVAGIPPTTHQLEWYNLSTLIFVW